MLTRSQIAKASADAQIAFCLDKQPTYEVALAREIEALMLSRIAELQETNALNNKVIDTQHRAMVNAEKRGVAKGVEESAERIAELEAKLAQRAEAQEPVAWRVHPFDYCIGSDGVYAVTHFDQQAETWRKKGWSVEPLFTRPQPAQLQTLSEEEVREAVRAEGMMYTAPDLRVAKAIQSALATKNGAELK